jgi:hypothetical protein
MFNLIKTVVSKFMNLFLRVFELIINMMLKGLHISLYVLTFGKEWFLWTFRNLFFILKVVGIFFLDWGMFLYSWFLKV